jgi:hypothetical protein
LPTEEHRGLADGTEQFHLHRAPVASQGHATDDAPGRHECRRQQLDDDTVAANGKPVHIAVWRQRQRVRVYMNQEKVWDMPERQRRRQIQFALSSSFPAAAATASTTWRTCASPPARGHAQQDLTKVNG